MPYIFVASAGRCGTKFMSTIWKRFTGYPSFHEPIPFCTGQTLREVNNECGINSDTKRELKTKLEQISIEAKKGNYFEANQMFIKSYVHLVAYKKEFRPLYVIYLHRNPIEVVMSYYKKTPERDLSWFLQPQWQRNIMRTRKGLSFYEIAFWQWYEIRARFFLWKDKFDKTYDFDFLKISDPEEYRRMFSHFGIEHNLPEKFPEDLFTPKNKNALEKDPVDVFNWLIEDWDLRGKETTKSAQDQFFFLMERRIQELQHEKFLERNGGKDK